MFYKQQWWAVVGVGDRALHAGAAEKERKTNMRASSLRKIWFFSAVIGVARVLVHVTPALWRWPSAAHDVRIGARVSVWVRGTGGDNGQTFNADGCLIQVRTVGSSAVQARLEGVARGLPVSWGWGGFWEDAFATI